jgi:hypothetical protein
MSSAFAAGSCRQNSTSLVMILLTQHTLDLRKFTPSKLTVNLCPLANGEALAISVPVGETRVLKHFQEQMSYGLFVPDIP